MMQKLLIPPSTKCADYLSHVQYWGCLLQLKIDIICKLFAHTFLIVKCKIKSNPFGVQYIWIANKKTHKYKLNYHIIDVADRWRDCCNLYKIDHCERGAFLHNGEAFVGDSNPHHALGLTLLHRTWTQFNILCICVSCRGQILWSEWSLFPGNRSHRSHSLSRRPRFQWWCWISWDQHAPVAPPSTRCGDFYDHI